MTNSVQQGRAYERVMVCGLFGLMTQCAGRKRVAPCLCVCTCVFRVPTRGFVLLTRQEKTYYSRLTMMSFNIWRLPPKDKVFPQPHGKDRLLSVYSFLSEQLPSTYSPEQLLGMKNIPDDPFPFTKAKGPVVSFFPHAHLRLYRPVKGRVSRIFQQTAKSLTRFSFFPFHEASLLTSKKLWSWLLFLCPLLFQFAHKFFNYESQVKIGIVRELNVAPCLDFIEY